MKPCLSVTVLGTLIAFGNVHAAQDPVPMRHTDRHDNIIIRTGETSYRPSGPAPTFDTLDTNHDGFISEDEARGYALLANDFQMADSNRDRRISRREYERWAARP